MKKTLILLIFLAFAHIAFSQTYDLIVKNNGDSIACKIDSLNDAYIYFAAKFRGEWFHTFLGRNDIKEFQREVLDKKKIYFEPNTSVIHDKIEGTPHINSYWLAPSGFGLEKGDGKYSTYYFLIHDIQYGLSNKFSVRVGTMVPPVVWYSLVNYSQPISKRSALSVGNMTILFSGVGSLFYGVYTFGDAENNFTVGAGYWIDNFINVDEFLTPPSEKNNKSAAFNFSAQVQLTDNTYFVTENFGLKFYLDHEAIYNGSGAYVEGSEMYAREDKIITGISGIRIISKKNYLKSWQIGVLYFCSINGNAPNTYNSTWDLGKSGETVLYPIPMIQYTRKFGKTFY